MEPSPTISPATPADYAALDAYVAAVAAELKVQGYEIMTTKQEFGGNVTPSGVNTSPNITFPAYAWVVSIVSLSVGMMLSVSNYKEFSGGDPVKEARRRIELAGGTLRPVVQISTQEPPAPVYALQQPFRDPADGNWYKYVGWPFNPSGVLKVACDPPAAPPAPAEITPTLLVAKEREEFSAYLQGVLAGKPQPQIVIDVLIAALTWVANRPK